MVKRDEHGHIDSTSLRDALVGLAHDPVHNPSHYISDRLQAWDVLDEFLGTDPLLWNAGKYLLRAGKKDDFVQDLEKAIVYIQRRIDKVKSVI